jgi:hypothetical protein
LVLAYVHLHQTKGLSPVKKQIFFLLQMLALIFLTSCSDNIVSECDVCTDNAAPETVTFSTIQTTVFSNNCVSCHSGNFASGGLDLSPNMAYENLVNSESNGSPLKRVEPFNSSASYLVKVLEGDNAPLMPPGAQLSQAKIDSVKSWIDRGAQND